MDDKRARSGPLGRTEEAEIDKRQAVIAELPRLRRYARALLRDSVNADDLVQDCVERALSRLTLFRSGTNMRGWLFTIMHNLHVNALRRRRYALDAEALNPGAEARIAVAPDQLSALAARDIGRGLERLPEEQRQVILLVGLEDLSYKEAARIIGVPIGTVMSRLARGREHLRQLMEEDPSLSRKVI